MARPKHLFLLYRERMSINQKNFSFYLMTRHQTTQDIASFVSDDSNLRRPKILEHVTQQVWDVLFKLYMTTLFQSRVLPVENVFVVKGYNNLEKIRCTVQTLSIANPTIWDVLMNHWCTEQHTEQVGQGKQADDWSIVNSVEKKTSSQWHHKEPPQSRGEGITGRRSCVGAFSSFCDW